MKISMTVKISNFCKQERYLWVHKKTDFDEKQRKKKKKLPLIKEKTCRCWKKTKWSQNFLQKTNKLSIKRN